MKRHSTQLTATDMFCGAGGSSIGFEAAGGELRMAANHWALAIETHNSNFPNAGHDCADVSQVNPRRYPSTDILLASPECTNHSLAKSGKKPSAQINFFGDGTTSSEEAERSRATMWDVPRFAEYHLYETIVVENVVEARKWPMFEAWLMSMTAIGYRHRALYLNSMFFGVPQSRDRMYVVFWKKGNTAPDLEFTPAAPCLNCERVVAAVQSWKDPTRPYGKYRSQYVYNCAICGKHVSPYIRAAATVIDWTQKGERIGDRLRPLAPATIERIKSGIKKYWKEGMVIPLDHSSSFKNPTGFGRPVPTFTARADKGVVMPFIAELRGGGSDSRSVAEALATIVASGNHHGLVEGPEPLYIKNYGDGLDPSMAHPVSDPLGAITTQDHHALLTPPAFLAILRGQSSTQRVEEPIGTLTSMGAHHGLVTGPNGMLVQVGGSLFERQGYARVRSTDEAMFAQTATPATALLTPAGGTWNEDATSSEDPFRTLTTRDTTGVVQPPAFIHSYYSGGGQLHDVIDPMPTVTTVDRHSLVESAPEVEDCHFRMLEPGEIQGGMAFPGTYNVVGNKRQKVRQLGNAVTPPVMSWINKRVIEALA